MNLVRINKYQTLVYISDLNVTSWVQERSLTGAELAITGEKSWQRLIVYSTLTLRGEMMTADPVYQVPWQLQMLMGEKFQRARRFLVNSP